MELAATPLAIRIRFSSIFNAEMKASCGMSTLPKARIFFLLRVQARARCPWTSLQNHRLFTVNWCPAPSANRYGETEMANGVFYHKADSQYDDQPDQRYHFPLQYLRRVESCVGDRVVYYGPISGKVGRFYTAIARVTRVRQDPNKANHYYADVDSYLDFDEPVYYLQHGGFEKKLIRRDGTISGGHNAVRIITPEEFAAIADAGLSSLLSLADDHLILQSRHLNYDVSHMLNKDMKAMVPSDLRLRPHPDYLHWHRINKFKA